MELSVCHPAEHCWSSESAMLATLLILYNNMCSLELGF